MTTEVYIGADHAGYELKEALVIELARKGYQVKDLGAYEYDEDDDFPDFVAPVARAISAAAQDPDPEAHGSVKGIVIGGSGQGEAIVANRFPHVRAVVFNGQYESSDGRDVPDEIALSREHNDSNILSLGARFLSVEDAVEAAERWLELPFSGDERHVRRLAKIESLDTSGNKHSHGDHPGTSFFD